jgi:hypothetical protein
MAEEAAEEVAAPVTTTPTGSAEELALVNFGALTGHLPSSSDDWAAHNCIAYDCASNPALEPAALSQYTTKFSYLPPDDPSGLGWSTIHAMAAYPVVFGLSPAEEAEEAEPMAEEAAEETVLSEASLEEQALVYFGAFYGRMPSSDDDWSALHCIAYGGCQGDPQDLEAEGLALVTFGAKYGKMPSTGIEWNVVHTLAYTDFLQADVEEEAAAEEEAGAEEDSSSEEGSGIGVFGELTGYLPSTDADWLFVQYVEEGYTPAEQDLDLESQALSKFVSVYGRLPASDADWNVISAIAYSGAIL